MRVHRRADARIAVSNRYMKPICDLYNTTPSATRNFCQFYATYSEPSALPLTKKSYPFLVIFKCHSPRLWAVYFSKILFVITGDVNSDYGLVVSSVLHTATLSAPRLCSVYCRWIKWIRSFGEMTADRIPKYSDQNNCPTATLYLVARENMWLATLRRTYSLLRRTYSLHLQRRNEDWSIAVICSWNYIICQNS
jgi:hypothetical protein